MITVHVMFHKDGDHLVIMKEPWWSNIYEWLLDRICPCCGVSGWMAQKLLPEKAFDFCWFRWQDLFNIIFNNQKELYKVSIESGCAAYRAIYDKDSTCWRDDCPHCWHLQDDAFTYEGDDETGN